MTTTSRAVLWAQADQVVRVRVKTVPGGTIPLDISSKSLRFVVRDRAGNLLLAVDDADITVANGVEDDGVTPTGGTDDMASIPITPAGIGESVAPGELYHGALWETSPSDQPLWEGPVVIRQAARQ